MEFRYIIATSTNPYENLALEQYLFQFAKEDFAILYLWQNQNTIVIGKNQNAYSECKVKEFLESGGRIARRKSGGGAVFHDLGNLNFSIITKSCDYEKVKYKDIIIAALHFFKVDAEFNGRNDLVIDNRKFSGNAFYDNGDICCQHGTILIDADVTKMEYYLTPDVSKLERNHVSSVSSRVLNLKEMNQNINVHSMQKAMISATSAGKLDVVINDEELKDGVKSLSDENWIFGGAE